jgi:prepilin-type processing-associated H-X9-DG protein
MLDGEHRFPSIPSSGPESFAGWTVVVMNEAGQLDLPSALRCPSIPLLPNDPVSVLSVSDREIPTREEYYAASPEQQQRWRFNLGGNRAFSHGVLDGGRPTGARLEGRTHFAIASDAPRIEDDVETYLVHDGRGVNIFYEDGHVAFVPIERVKSPDRLLRRRSSIYSTLISTSGLGGLDEGGRALPLEPWKAVDDSPFCNFEGERGYGINSNDAVLGPSHSSPFPK